MSSSSVEACCTSVDNRCSSRPNTVSAPPKATSACAIHSSIFSRTPGRSPCRTSNPNTSRSYRSITRSSLNTGLPPSSSCTSLSAKSATASSVNSMVSVPLGLGEGDDPCSGRENKDPMRTGLSCGIKESPDFTGTPESSLAVAFPIGQVHLLSI
ncbi:hypothetical protein EMIT0357P_130001 [Pseudomonas marginalis]